MRIRIATWSTVLVVAALLTGCGAQPSDPSATPAIPGSSIVPPTDPCARLDAAGLQAITGWDLARGSRPSAYEQPGQMVCNWEAADLRGAVQLQVQATGGRAQFDQRRAATVAEGLPASVDLVVPGADAAYEVPGHGIVGLLVGSEFLQLRVIGPAAGDGRPADPLPALAAEVVAKGAGS